MQLFTSRQWTLLLSLSTAVLAFLFWWIYGYAGTGSEAPAWTHYLSAANAVFNGLSAVCLVLGFLAIRSREIKKHFSYMATALGFSTLFLLSYLMHHHFHGDTLYAGPESLRLVYYAILISHILLTIFVLPMILGTVFLALTSSFDKHKKIARVTLPIWLYISVTGVLIYLFHLL